LIERETGKAQHITRWPLGLDASLTPTPAEPRNTVMPIKSLTPQAIVLDEAEAEQENRDADKVAMPAHQTPTETIKELKKMDEPTKVDTAMADEVKALSAEVKALKEVIESAPVVSALKAGHVEVVKDPADIPFASLGAQFAAVKAFTVSNSRTIAPRLQYLTSIKAPLGGNESTPSEGGFLIDPTLSAELLMPLHETGPFVPAARKLPVGNNSNYGWINGVNETDRTSRWGGIVGYRLAEAGTKVASQPKFRRINWELKKYAVLIYGTDELLADAAQFSAVVRMGAAEELAFMANDDVLNGAGAAGPLGILSSGAVVSQAKETNQAAATIKYENLIKMWARLLPRSKANAKWFVNSDCSQQLDQLSFAVGTAALQPNFVSYNDEGVMSIKGKPVIETEFNATLGTEGDIVLADMSEYLFWEKGGVQEASSIHVAFLTDETVFRLVYRCDGQPSMAAPMTPYKGSVTQGAFVSLAVRA
jgi:HK97 family phage major capsid protein